MKRRLLVIDAALECWRLRTLDSDSPASDPREDYGLLAGESLCQFLLREDPESLIIARGPLPFLAGNKGGVDSEERYSDFGYDSEYGIGGWACMLNTARYVAVAPRKAEADVRNLHFTAR